MKRAPKTITNPNVPSESIFYKLSDFVLEIFLRGHMTEEIDFKCCKMGRFYKNFGKIDSRSFFKPHGTST